MRLVGRLLIGGALAGAALGGFSWTPPTDGGATPTPTPTPTPLISAINANGWSATWASGAPPAFQPDTAPATFAVARAGFTAAGTPTTYNEIRTFTARIRQPAPNDAVLTADQVALDDYVYSTDAITGVSILSTETSPKPVAQWSDAQRRLIDGGRVQGGVIADHRDGVACVVVTVSDGLITRSQTIAAPTIAARTGDQSAIAEYRYDIDVSDMAAGALTRSALVYPFLGAAASVLNSADQAVGTKSFCNQTDWKGVRYYIYVDPASGSDATGVVSTNAATAAAAPAASIAGALVRARAAMPGNRVSGLEIRLRAGTYGAPTVTFNTYQDATAGEVVLTRDPAVAKSAVIYSFAAAGSWQLTSVRFADITVVRTAYTYVGLGFAVFRDCDIDGGGQGVPLSQNAYYLEGGCTVTAAGNGLVGANCYMLRGVVVTDSAAVINWHVVGCRLFGRMDSNGQPENGAIITGNRIKFPTAAGATTGLDIGYGAATIGVIFSQNIIEWYTTLGGANIGRAIGISADGGAANTSHIIIRHNTSAGGYSAGRWNLFYDESAGTTRRTHKLFRFEGNLITQLNTKSDRFVAVNQSNPAEAPNRTGSWPFMYGVGCRFNIVASVDAAGSPGFRQDYPGLHCSIGTTAVGVDLRFSAPACVSYTGSAYADGAGNGDYTLQPASPAKAYAAVERGTPPFDFTGAARGGPNTSAGAYA